VYTLSSAPSHSRQHPWWGGGGGGGARALIGINPAVLDDDGAAIERSKLPCFAARLPPCDVLRARGHVRNSQDVAPKDLIISDQVRVQ